ncbi:hypothetical protein L3Q82_007884 [Scortum barcoo]|uniref:Uncharacterized protein n=1 Tax=Scortum barcoo TaxID=214431 RepID=A0ACB8WK11_9TELE|nr:hypothetical protein L3Q82_007884 [Scortum barcoo]
MERDFHHRRFHGRSRMEEVKDFLAPLDISRDLESLVEIASRIDNRLRERERETSAGSQVFGVPRGRRTPSVSFADRATCLHPSTRVSLAPCWSRGTYAAGQDQISLRSRKSDREGSRRAPVSIAGNQVTRSPDTTCDPIPDHSDYPDLSKVPPCCYDLKEVFNKTKATSLPPHREWDCAIELLPGAPIPKARLLYSLSGPERKAMEEYITASLRVRHHPSLLLGLLGQDSSSWVLIRLLENQLYVVHGYQPPVFSACEQEVTVPSAHALVRRSHKIWEAARDMLQKGQARMKAAADRGHVGRLQHINQARKCGFLQKTFHYTSIPENWRPANFRRWPGHVLVYWLKQGDTSGTAGFESLAALVCY